MLNLKLGRYRGPTGREDRPKVNESDFNDQKGNEKDEESLPEID